MPRHAAAGQTNLVTDMADGLSRRLVRAAGARLSCWCVAVILLLCGRYAAGQTPVLTTVKVVHELSDERARELVPIRLKGVVTSLSTWPNAFFFQDATGGISVESDHPTGVYVGAKVELAGHTGPGLFAPVAKATQVHVLGKGKMPAERLFSYLELTGGNEDSNWIAVRGVIRSAKRDVSWNLPVMNLEVEVDSSMILVQLFDYTGADPAQLVDAVVKLRGVCTTAFNDKRQFTGVRMAVPSMAFVTIEEKAEADPYSLPVTRVRSLLQFKPGQRFGHRVHIMGTVTYQDEGRSLYLQDGTDGVLVETDQPLAVPLGTKISAVGFPASGTYSPILREAGFRVLQAGPQLMAARITVADFLHRGKFITAPYDAQLIQVQGKLFESIEGLNDNTWLVRDGGTRIAAVLLRKPGGPPLPSIQTGSTVSVTGIFSVQVDDNHEPAWFRVLLRQPEDLMVVNKASWWTAKHALGVLAGVLVAMLAVALWGGLLRRTVRQQTQMLRESEERFRKQAQQDALTGLASRSYLCETLQKAVGEARRSGDKLGVLMVDLDHFKQVNDTIGHHAGDELLRLVAGRLRASVRKGDTVARMGGDEFVVILADIHDAAEAAAIGAKVVANVAQPAVIAGREMMVSASVGVCLYPEGGTEENALLQNVDAAMYKAKAAGRNNFSVYMGAAMEQGELVTAQA